jgi:hypothetical protein
LREWLGSYRGLQECAWYAADDIMPFLHMCPSFSMRLLRKVFRKTGAIFRLASASATQYAVGIG